MLNKKKTLNNGVEIPQLGFGTFEFFDDVCYKAVKDAISVGYRNFDTALEYANEKEVGKAVRNSEIDRKEIFISTKVPPHVKSYDEAKKAIEESLNNLDLGYIDLLLIHCPQPWDEYFAKSTNRYFKENLEVWKAMSEAYEQGKVKAIGVSNFNVEDLENIINNSDIVPAVDQVRVHIGHIEKEIMEYCEKHGIVVEAYAPLASGQLIGHEEIMDIARKYGATIQQLSLKFDIQQGVVPLPKVDIVEYMESNARLDFEISEEDMEYLKSIPEITNYVYKGSEE